MQPSLATSEVKLTFVLTSLCMDPDGGWLVSGSTDGTLKVWETDTGRCRLSQPCFRQGVAAVAV